jgi:catechol 2,3-dioxygenase-like lactoylglutathione lyase family enzyme
MVPVRLAMGAWPPARGRRPLGAPSTEVLSSRVLLSPRDLERSLRFYEETLGLAVYRGWGQGGARGVIFFLGGGELLEVSGSSAEPASGSVRLFLQVRDLRAAHERLTALGVPIEQEPTVRPWGLFEMVARDPDGLALVFVEVPPTHPLRRRG